MAHLVLVASFTNCSEVFGLGPNLESLEQSNCDCSSIYVQILEGIKSDTNNPFREPIVDALRVVTCH